MTVTEVPVKVPRDADWQDFAACSGRLELFFGKVAKRTEARHRPEQRARRLCDACVVRQSCREFARVNHEYGFWGGENEAERHLAGYALTAPIGIRVRLPHDEAEAS